MAQETPSSVPFHSEPMIVKSTKSKSRKRHRELHTQDSIDIDEPTQEDSLCSNDEHKTCAFVCKKRRNRKRCKTEVAMDNTGEQQEGQNRAGVEDTSNEVENTGLEFSEVESATGSSMSPEVEQWLNQIHIETSDLIHRSHQVLWRTALPTQTITDCVSLLKARIQWILHRALQEQSPPSVVQKLFLFFKSIAPSIQTGTESGTSVVCSEVSFWTDQLVQHRLSTEVIKQLVAEKPTPSTVSKKAEYHDVPPSVRSPLPLGLISGPEFQRGRREFTHGNYNTYYRWRSEALSKEAQEKLIEEAPQFAWIDPRLSLLSRKYQLEVFTGKCVLDVGCNVGHLAITIAGLLGAFRVTGVDICVQLISKALETLRAIKFHFYFKHLPTCSVPGLNQDNPLSYFRHFLPPVPNSIHEFSDPLKSLSQAVGTSNVPNEPPSLPFPFNIEFRAEEFSRFPKPGHSNATRSEIGTYDTIMALSVTKWIHLNTGDQGMKRTFRKIYEFLKPGEGKVLSIPQ